jgi:hypothetical protein
MSSAHRFDRHAEADVLPRRTPLPSNTVLVLVLVLPVSM